MESIQTDNQKPGEFDWNSLISLLCFRNRDGVNNEMIAIRLLLTSMKF